MNTQPKVERFEKRPDIVDVDLTNSKRLRIWITPKTRITIRPGDTIGGVITVLKKERFKVDGVNPKQLVAFWFALGERMARKKTGRAWTRKELDPSPSRAYLKS